VWPAASRWRAISLPMFPMPMKPKCMGDFLSA
jgi:hypothetical protein